MKEISYEEFGANFVAQIVTPERVGATIARLAGDEVHAGPMNAGPGGAASVTAKGRVGPIRPQARLDREMLAFEAAIPIDLYLDVRVAGGSYWYRAAVRVPLHLSVRAVEPVTLVIDVDPVSSGEVEVALSADGIRARVLQRLGNMEDEVRRAVAAIVNERLDSDEAKEVRLIDVLSYVDSAWKL